MKGGTLNNDVRAQEYYRIAYKCIELSQTKKGCNGICAACTLNIHLYVDDVKEATLIKTSAGIDWQRGQLIKAHESGVAWGQLIWSIILIGLLITAVAWPVSCFRKHWVRPTGPQQESTSYASTATPDVERRVLKTLKDVYAVQMTDKNKDGMLNCIDYAVTFYELYGPEARLVWVVIKPCELTHLYCAVPNGYGGWLHIETYTYKMSLSTALMQYTYGTVFNTYKRKDVTTDYNKIITGNYVWRW